MSTATICNRCGEARFPGKHCGCPTGVKEHDPDPKLVCDCGGTTDETCVDCGGPHCYHCRVNQTKAHCPDPHPRPDEPDPWIGDRR